MKSENILIFVPVITVMIFAVLCEIRDQKNAYLLNKASDKDSINRSFQKLKNCIIYDIKTVKWRRIFISTVISVFFVYIIALKRFPTAKELIISIAAIFIPFYFSYNNYANTTSKEAFKYSLENINNIKSIIKKKIIL